MSSILLSLAPLIGLILIGYYLKQKTFLSTDFWSGAEKLNYYLFFPAMLFGNLAKADIQFSMVQTIVMMLAVVLGIICLILIILKKILDIPATRFGVYMQANARFNTYIGLAIVTSLFPPQAFTIFAVLLAISIPVVNILSVLALSDHSQMNYRMILLSLMKNPLILGCIFGILFNLSGLALAESLAQLMKLLAACSLPLGLMCVGAALQFVALKASLLPLLLNTVSRLLLVPALAFLTAGWLGLKPIELQVFILYFALPTASASYILTKVCGGDSQLMAGIISLQMLCAAVSLPLILTLVLPL